MFRFFQGIEYSNQFFNYYTSAHSSCCLPVPTVFCCLSVPTVCAAFSAHSVCCPPVLGFGFRATASASTFSEISSYSYKVTGFQKRLFQVKTKTDFLSPQHLVVWPPGEPLVGPPGLRPGLQVCIIKQFIPRHFFHCIRLSQHWNYPN